MLYANLVGNHKSGFKLEITNDIQTRKPMVTVNGLKGIKEARATAKRYNAKCWNF